MVLAVNVEYKKLVQSYHGVSNKRKHLCATVKYPI